jgi:hypothetical protein
MSSDMKDNYDFSQGERGKFFNPTAQFRFPIYLDTPVQDYLSQRAQVKGIDLSSFVNDLLKRDIELVRAVA